MDNDQTRLEVEEILRTIPPTLKKGDKISHREIAESIARCFRLNPSNRDVSEEEVQKVLKWMNHEDERRRSTSEEKSYLVGGWSLFLVCFVIALIGILVDDIAILSVSVVAAILGFVFMMVHDRKRHKRIMNLPPPPPL